MAQPEHVRTSVLEIAHEHAGPPDRTCSPTRLAPASCCCKPYPVVRVPQSAAEVRKGCRTDGPRPLSALISITLGSQADYRVL
jgi:hypothetical protein